MVKIWSHQVTREWLGSQLLAQPVTVVDRIEELLAQGIAVEVPEEPDWSVILPLLGADFRESLHTVLSFPSLQPADESAVLGRWMECRARLQAIFVDQDWWGRLWSHLDELAKAGKAASSVGKTMESSDAIGSGLAAENLMSRLTGAESVLDLNFLLSLGSVSAHMQQFLEPELVAAIGEAGGILEPLLSHCRPIVALCWRCTPDVSHFGMIFGRAYRGFQAAVVAIQDTSIEAMNARAGWLGLLEVERFLVEREQVKALSGELRRQLERAPTVNELCAAYYQPESGEALRQPWLENLAGFRELLLRRKSREATDKVLDHWELNPSLAHPGPISAPLSDRESEATRIFKNPDLTTPEGRVLAWHLGFVDGKHRSFSEIAAQFGLPKELVGRLERRGLRKLRHELG